MPRQPYKEIIKAEVELLGEAHREYVVRREEAKAACMVHRTFNDTGKAHMAECREKYFEGLAEAYSRVRDRLNECLMKADPEPVVTTDDPHSQAMLQVKGSPTGDVLEAMVTTLGIPDYKQAQEILEQYGDEPLEVKPITAGE